MRDPRARADGAITKMPVARYFLYVGGVLLALLFLSDAYSPSMPVVAATQTGVDKSIIRIHSDRKWPERVVFDTNLPTIVPPSMVTAAARVATPLVVAQPVVAQSVVAEVAAKAQPPLQAFAQLRPAEPIKAKPQHKQRKVAKVRVAPPMVLVAQQPRSFFDSNTW
jgi:hypothetical protein